MVADQLLTTLEHEYRDLDEGERNAAIIAVTMTFERAQLTDKQLFTADLDRLYLYQFVRRFTGNAISGLSEGGIALYERVLEQCCGYIIVIADKLPGFQVDAFAELLRRSRQILDRQDEMLRLLPETSRDQQHASVDIAYRQLLVRVFDRLQLLGLDFTSQWYSLSIAYVSLTIASAQKSQRRQVRSMAGRVPSPSHQRPGRQRQDHRAAMAGGPSRAARLYPGRRAAQRADAVFHQAEGVRRG